MQHSQFFRSFHHHRSGGRQHWSLSCPSAEDFSSCSESTCRFRRSDAPVQFSCRSCSSFHLPRHHSVPVQRKYAERLYAPVSLSLEPLTPVCCYSGSFFGRESFRPPQV